MRVNLSLLWAKALVLSQMPKGRLRAAAATVLTFEVSPSAIVRGRIWKMEDLGYFTKGDVKTPKVMPVPEPNIDEVVVFKDFFSAGLHMPPHQALADIMLKFKI
jgi:hypothetical protein